ncbi:MAG: diacylglycerol/lipid kinase family protein [Leptospirillia bacterium]
MTVRRPILVGNPHAGSNARRRGFSNLKAAFLRRFPEGSVTSDLLAPQDPALPERLGSTDLLVLYGGDGTVARLLSLPLSLLPPLLVLPGGTGNVLSRFLGVPYDPARPGEIFSLLGRGHSVKFFPGIAGETLFCLMAGVGWDGVAARRVRRKRELGALSYYLAGLSATFSPAASRFCVQLLSEEGEELVREDVVWALVSRIPPYFGPFRVRGAGPEDSPFLTATIVRGTTLRVPGAFFEMLPGMPGGLFSERFRIRELSLLPGRTPFGEDGKGAPPCQADGEAIPPFFRVGVGKEPVTFLGFSK